MIGQTLGHYRIIEKIGAGGMGEVYRARDERLERDVAIKVLPAGLLADEAARKRFRKEALALSKLNHPNIETVHDFDTQDGVDFLVMEFLAGETLDQKLARGPLLEKELVRLGAQLAEGLAAAHEQGVVHRDLKPANLRVMPDGRLKILDFGLAKLLAPEASVGTATTESLTETQAVRGTLPYMAPEQLQGEAVDARTDIWATGAVLYEMATGRRPFEAKLTTALIGDIQTKPVTPPSQLNPKISSRLEEIILKCLEKEPENRYQSAKELAVDLRRLAAPGVEVSRRQVPPGWARWVVRLGLGLAGAAVVVAVLVGLNVGGWFDTAHHKLRERVFRSIGRGTPRIESLAVLPLKNLSPDPGQEYFVEGMHEALITELSKISALKVISRTSAMRYKQTDKPLPQIARELGVDALIEGSVLREGDQVRITVQLLHGQTDRHLWADNYQRELRGILALQSEVAQAIAREIRVTLTPAEATRLASARPVNPEAYEFYLRGRYHSDRRTEEELRKGLGYFQAAVEADPRYALGYVGLADTYRLLANYGTLPPSEAFPRARAALAKALEIDDTLAEAHASLAQTYMYVDLDWQAADREYQRSLELDPNYSTAYHWYALHISARGRHEEAIREIKRARELDPLSPIIRGAEVMIFFYARNYDETIKECQKALELDPSFGWFHGWQGAAYLEKGMLDKAVAGFEQHARMIGSTNVRARLGYAYARTGRRGEAVKIARELEELSKRQYVSSYDIALVYVGLGGKTQAFTWLERAYRAKDGATWLPFLKVSPWFDGLRDHPRFQTLLRRMNFPP